MTAGLSRRSAWASPVRDGPIIDSSRLHPVAHRIEIAKTRVIKSTGLMRSGRLIPASCVDGGSFPRARVGCEGDHPDQVMRAANDERRGVLYQKMTGGGGRIRTHGALQ